MVLQNFAVFLCLQLAFLGHPRGFVVPEFSGIHFEDGDRTRVVDKGGNRMLDLVFFTCKSQRLNAEGWVIDEFSNVGNMYRPNLSPTCLLSGLKNSPAPNLVVQEGQPKSSTK